MEPPVTRLPLQGDEISTVTCVLEPLRQRERTRLCTVAEVGSGRRHFRYHAKVEYFEEKSYECYFEVRHARDYSPSCL